ncbi:MAG: L,D-transpeptidase [Actinobacteria bacterium]|nr:L,D-transpeptidase [Actinomycetota bacterium]
MGAALVFAVLAAAGVVTMLTLAGGDAGGSEPHARPFRPEPDDSFPAGLEGPNTYPVARISGRRLLYRQPGGTAKVRIADQTEWDTPRVLSVVKHRRDWLAVLAPELKNGELGWIPMSEVRRLSAVTWALDVDLSRREVVVRRGGKRVRRLRVGVGRPGHSTPTGRFAVTDRLRVTDPASPYGCCVLALTAHQTRLPPGWPGGDRVAMHATANPSDLGQAVSTGCLRADPRDARWLIKKVPLGTPVFIRE